MTDTATIGADNTNPPASFEAGSDDLTQYLAAVLGEDDPEKGQGNATESRADSPVPAGQESDTKQEEADPDPVFTVKVNGEERSVTRDELLRGYQTAQAANQRFEEAAAIRRQHEQAVQQVMAERQALANALEQYQAQMAQTLQPPDERLLESDPVEYLKQQRQYDAKVREVRQAQAAQAYLSQQQQVEQQQRHQAFLAEQAQKLIEVIPEWKDQSKAQQGKVELRNYLQKQGYGDDVIGSLADHRVVVMARKAMLFDQLVAQRDSATKKVQHLPPVRTEKPGGGDRDARGRFSSQNMPASLTVDDAAKALFEMMSGEAA